MQAARLLIAIVLCSIVSSFALQAEETSSAAIRLDKKVTSRWRFGVEVAATGNTTGVVATLPIPMDWPEQKVKIIEETVSPRAKKIAYRTLDGGVKQMLVTIPRLAAGEEASAIITLEIEKAWIEAPTETASLRVPTKPPRDFAKYLGASPFIETGDAHIKQVASQAAGDEADAWKRTHALFTWVRANVKYQFAERIKPAAEALRDGEGDCEELSSLFIAVCRINKIPARAVWVPGHTYPEFYLEDEAGRGHWYPCQAAGEMPDFGRMPEDRPILQKGDNFKVPGQSGAQRYVMQSLSAKNADGPPTVKFIMERVKAP